MCEVCFDVSPRPSTKQDDPLREAVQRLNDVAFEIELHPQAFNFANCDGSFAAIVGRILKKVNGDP